ncbi:hypothetical protein EAF04_004437 [Stromatinia cepivora]|nr:hypothetical protein EAF04_004437 [Stromatinia cepivora]
MNEQHELAWCLGCVCGIRPGSLAEVAIRKGHYLRRQDTATTCISRSYDSRVISSSKVWPDYAFRIIEVDLMLEMGTSENQELYIERFNMMITFPYLKINSEEDAQTGKEVRVLQMIFNYIQNPENITLSPTLRALGIMLRRGVIDITSVDALLNPLPAEAFRTISIKPEFRDRPVFIAALPGGRGLDPSGRPLSTDGLGAFFKRRAIAAGYPETVSMYAWRRGLATLLNRATNTQTFRAILAHKPDSTTFEEHYNGPTVSVDLLAIAYTEKQRPIENEAHPALYRIQYSWTPAEEEKFLQAIVDQDPAYKSAKDAGERKRAAKNARYRGRLSMREQQRAEQEKVLTSQEYEARIYNLRQNSSLYNELLARAIKIADSEIGDDLEDIDIYKDINESLNIIFRDKKS